MIITNLFIAELLNHKEKQRGCPRLENKNFSTNLLGGLFGNKIEKLFIYYVYKNMVISKRSNWDEFIKKEFIKKPINLH